MKKILAYLMAFIFLFFSVSLAEDVSSPSVSMRFRDAVDAAGEFVTVGGDLDYLAAVIEKEGKYIRSVTLLDDHARELYMAAMAAEASGDAFEVFQAYAWSLPISYTEEITAKPKPQAELDALAGKTVGELAEEGYVFFGAGGGVDLPTVIDLSCGLFVYEFEVDASFDQYLEQEDWDKLKNLKVKSGKLSVFSSLATNLDYLADGTYAPQFVPHITAEEAEAAALIPPLEEYSSKAWPLTAENYAVLMRDTEAGYGQVYMIEGVVHQILSQSPLSMIVNTGEDGKSQPVVIECPESVSFSPEAGNSCRIYADVSSACYILPVLTARYIFSVRTEGPADTAPAAAGHGFTVPGIVPANEIGDFFGEWQYCWIMNEDGSEMSREDMMADGIVDDRPEIVITEDGVSMYAASLGDVATVKYEFNPEDGTLRILNDSDKLPVFCLTDNGMLCLFIPSDLSSGDTTAYLTRKQP